ncbi:hypothetical protein NUU61_005238 [Penicillium alfredii]|uniref:Uncharacterized protein n=1 Tax=Penicillium alfredii TaxID=1506179 RepID=A0A9W9K8D7_9EURO|nr:uncharacterized protein NUU61_005238 [Penicillium alfredii]KAJ5095882.1 hypothetical protein NUU61_005238 [Penicillium alfredii]
MDQPKTQSSGQVKKSQQTTNVEQYQQRWEQLIQDTNKQIQKIRAIIEEEKAKRSNESSQQ